MPTGDFKSVSLTAKAKARLDHTYNSLRLNGLGVLPPHLQPKAFTISDIVIAACAALDLAIEDHAIANGAKTRKRGPRSKLLRSRA